MTQKKSSRANSILIQGSILVITSFISRIIGLAYRFPLTRILGKVGMDYYGTAYSIYSILLIISTYSVPTAISKMISEREARGEKENSRRIFKGSIVFMSIIGLIMSLVFYFASDLLAASVQTPMSAIALRVLAPVLLVTSILGVIRGFFQGFNTMVPTAISQIIEQIANAVVSVAAAYVLYRYGEKIGPLLNSQNMAAAYGAAGGTLGTVAGAVCALIFLLFILFAYNKKQRRHYHVSQAEHADSYRTIIFAMLSTVIPIVVSSVVYNITSVAEMYVFKNIAVVQNYSAKQISEWWTAYSQEFIILQNVPVAVASSLASPIVPSLAESYVQKDRKGIQAKTNSVTRFIMAIVLPITIGMFVLAGPILKLLFGDSDPTSARIMMLGAISIPFFSISAMSSGILQGINKLKVPVKNSLITLFAHMGLLAVLLLVFHLNIYAVVIANAFDGILMAVMNDLSVHRFTGTRYNLSKTFVLPLFSSVIMGAGVYAVYHILNVITSSNSIACILAILFGICLYFAVILKTGGITESELKRIPKGGALVRLAKKLHLL